MSAHLFKSINGQPHRPRPKTADDLAADLALDMIERIKARRALAQQKDVNCEEAEPWLTSDTEAYETLETLLKGVHRKTVVTLLLTHFPELVAKMKVH